MKKGYLDIENGVIVWNPEEKPLPGAFIEDRFRSFHTDEETYNFVMALQQWRSECVEVENGNKLYGEYYVWIRDEYLMKANAHKITPGQSAYIDGKTVVKLAA